MPTLHRRLLTSPLVALAFVTLAACGGQSAPQTRAPEASSDATPTAAPAPAKGTCWDDQQLPAVLGEEGFAAWVEKYAGGDPKSAESLSDDAAFTEPIDCTSPHSLEVYNLVELSPKLTTEIKSYADLLDPDSALYRKVRDEVNDRCAAGSAYGRAQAKAKLPVQLGPSLNPEAGLHVAWDPVPADLWAKGQKAFVCTFEQDKPGTIAYADLVTKKVPIAARVCLNTPGKKVPCAEKHQAEDIGGMILNTAIARKQINGAKAVRKGPDGKYVALSDKEYAKLDKVCQNLLDQVSDVKGDVEARAYPGSVSQWPTDGGVYVATCFALKPFEPPPPVKGTVFDKA